MHGRKTRGGYGDAGVLALAGMPLSTHASAPTVFFSESFDAGMGAWWAEPGWGVTDNRAVSGLAAYFGDDRGTPDPADNNVDLCAGTICQRELRSPVFVAGEGAHLYVWMYFDLTLDPNVRVFLEDMSAGYPSGRVTLLEPDMLPGWLFHADLEAWAGQPVRLVFLADVVVLGHGQEGMYVDEVVVTDAEVPTETIVRQEGQGPAAALAFDVHDDTSAFIELTIEGPYVGPTLGLIDMFRHDGELVWMAATAYGGGSWLYGTLDFWDPHNATLSAGASVSLQALGLTDFDEDIGLTMGEDGQVRLSATLFLSRLPVGTWEFSVALFGVGGGMATVELHVQDGPLMYGASLGGEQLALEYPGGFDAAFESTVAGGLVAMVDGTLQRTANARSVGASFAYAEVLEGFAMTTPTGPLENVRVAYADAPGAWNIAVDTAAYGVDDPFPWAMIATLPPVPAIEVVSGAPLSSVPRASLGEGPQDAAQSRRWLIAGPMACQVTVVYTLPPGCFLHPLFFSVDSFGLGIRSDLSRITFTLRSPAEWLGPLDVTDAVTSWCVEVTAPGAFTKEACTEGPGPVVLYDNGDPPLGADSVLTFEVRVDDPGVALIEKWDLDLAIDYGA